MSGNFLNTFAAIRWANWLENRRVAKEREHLLNTIATIEAELAKPEYFGFFVERDKMGYLEALSQTKTTFGGINPHDPLNGMVVNGEINPDFVTMLEKIFFKVSSENLDKDELCLVRYQAERDKMIEWLKQEFQVLSIDDEYLMKEIGISQEKLFQKLQTNTLIFAIGVENQETCIADICSYLNGVEHQNFFETFPIKFCKSNEMSAFCKKLDFIDKKQNEIKAETDRRNKEAYERGKKETIRGVLIFLFCSFVCLLLFIYLTNFLSQK